MPRLRNTRTGVVVNVDDDTASRLGSEWRPYPRKGAAATPEPDDGAPKGNASRDEWADYATSLGIEVPEDAKRDDIKAAVEAAAADNAGVPDDADDEEEGR